MSIPTPPNSSPQGNHAGHSTSAPADPNVGPAGAGIPTDSPIAAPVQSTPNVKRPRNTIGLIAFITSVVGFIFACVPGALIVGWVLLPIAFILALVSLFMKGRGKGLGITALILSVVGTIVGFVVFFAVVSTSFDEAFSGGETTIAAPVDALESSETSDEAPQQDADTQESAEESTAGSREKPLPVGSAITQGDWTITVNSVNLDAADTVAAENQFNDPAPEGSVYVLVELTAAYNGTDPEGAMPFTSVEFVTAGGNTLHSYESAVVVPNSFDLISTLYAGASTTGNLVFTVPAADAAAGTLAVTPTMLGDKFFVAVQ